ncbi:protein-export chaperone SecB [Vibrio alginolyticus]|uniref:Preprotein translocase subunit SecB n=1 Tax=Vibrio alginolyticus TaxID=663 RepID=A0AA36UVY3_VIBAL|nr:protein-export chaperone SecB [Vibrio alginolyticus]HCG9059611.1 protein-export chaperone SecB [Vibrio parahaemolyticus]EGQ9137185.1 hypothetical protein [Vibrio alginolyticus]EGR0171212.1 hypothetical protein [Vibrio alginolyticus]EGR1298912.1 hypothetical protein [Vibrio alginolyticus]ELN6937840.1 protein-export chaperone SecB [Vibrio alginolyticus]
MWPEDSFTIRSINYPKLYVELNSDFDQENESVSNISIQTAKSSFDKRDGTIGVKMRAQFGFDNEDGAYLQQEDVPFWLDAQVEVIFGFSSENDEVSEEEIETWIENHSLRVIYPYLREAVSSLASKSGLDDVILPIIKL